MANIELSSNFKKQFKRVNKTPRWKPIFNKPVPFEDDNRSPWQYVTDCFLNDSPIPEYFYEHKLKLSSKVTKQIKQQVKDKTLEILTLELHLDGYNGDHLLVYGKTAETIYLLAIGTHSGLF